MNKSIHSEEMGYIQDAFAVGIIKLLISNKGDLSDDIIKSLNESMLEKSKRLMVRELLR